MMRSLLLKNPIPTKMDFASGGSRVPILTRNPTQTTAGFQTFGLPTGSSSGGSANKTTLGAIRMGDQDGNAPASAIYPGDIFYPPGQAERKYTEVTFQCIGNNVFQPESIQQAEATESLLQRIGDRKFKAIESAPFEDYLAKERLARDVDSAARFSSLEDQGYAREIIRNVVADRRKGNEADYLRRMLDAGMNPEEAQLQVDTVRRANALQEARTVEDRTHQSKILIQRMARSRGILSSVNEPLTTSGAIENPQPNEKMAAMSGQPENAYGSSSLDRNRQYTTTTNLHSRPTISQEANDELSALANASAQASGNVPTPLMLEGLEREIAIESVRDSVASRLDAVKSGKRVMLPLPPIAEPFTDLLMPSYRGKTAGSMARFKEEDVQDLSAFHSFVALNQAIASDPSLFAKFKRLLSGEQLTERGTETPRRDIRGFLRTVTLRLIGRPQISIPFGGERHEVTDASILNILQRIKGSSTSEVSSTESIMKGYEGDEAQDPRKPSRKLNLGGGGALPVPPLPVQLPLPVPSRYTSQQLSALSVKELQEICRNMRLPTSGRKATIIQRILDA